VDSLAHSPVGSNVLQLLSQTVSIAPWVTVMRYSPHDVYLARHHQWQGVQETKQFQEPVLTLEVYQNEFITAMTETNVLNKPVPVRTGRLTVPVRLLGE